MFKIVEKRHWYFLLSALIIIPGLIAIVYSSVKYGAPVQLGIDFKGGTLWEIGLDRPAEPATVRQVFASNGLQAVVQTTGDQTILIRTEKDLSPEAKQQVGDSLRDSLGSYSELRYEVVGPAVGAEVTRAAVWAIGVAALFIMLYILYAFRKVPNAIRYGVCAVVSMLHDILVTVGLFSLAGLLFGWQADALILTAVLTVIGFSVQDTIVVYDRIRENIPRRRGEPFETIVNRSLLETLHRSLATQLNAMFVLIALLFFGGATMKQFVAVLLVGMISGTYSSIFNAVPLVVVWETGKLIGGRRKPQASGA